MQASQILRRTFVVLLSVVVLTGCDTSRRPLGDGGAEGGARGDGDGIPRVPDAGEPPEPGDCIGEAFDCSRIATGECLDQRGCFPSEVCEGEELDCRMLTVETCESYPHCTLENIGGLVCIPFSNSGCPWRMPPGCEEVGGTCTSAMTCGGDADICEAFLERVGCEGQQGCFWQSRG